MLVIELVSVCELIIATGTRELLIVIARTKRDQVQMKDYIFTGSYLDLICKRRDDILRILTGRWNPL